MRLRGLCLSGAIPAFVCAATILGDDCTGLPPLTDMSIGQRYFGFEGRLYPGVKNYDSGNHLADALKASMIVRPLDASGRPDPGGKIVLLSIGMSNTTQEFSRFRQKVLQFADRNPALVVVDGAQGGQDARRIADPNAQFWTNIDARLQQAGCTREQVQVIWHKEAIARPTDPFPQHAEELRDLNKIAMNIIKSRFPNTRLAYVSSRTYAGWAQTNLNPEPYAYESGYSVKWMIDDQTNGDPQLNYDARLGEVRSPVLQWGAYLWADGICGRNDGFSWSREDFGSDGTHPSASGREKVANLLMAHFTSDPTARLWFLKPSLRVLVGDMNGNRMIDGDDAEAYILYMFDPAEFAKQFPHVDPIEAGDITRDGITDNLDLLEFIPVLIRFSEL